MISFDLVRRVCSTLNSPRGCILSHVAGGDIVVGGDHEEDCPSATDAVGQKGDIVNTTLEDLHLFAVYKLGI